MEVYRPIVLSMRLSKAENAAVNILAETEGLPKSLYLRSHLRHTINDHAATIPAKILKAIQAQQRMEVQL